MGRCGMATNIEISTILNIFATIGSVGWATYLFRKLWRGCPLLRFPAGGCVVQRELLSGQI
jgi:hypothetical protein